MGGKINIEIKKFDFQIFNKFQVTEPNRNGTRDCGLFLISVNGGHGD